MLGKLMKYEIRATGRIFLPLYGLILLSAAILRGFMAANEKANNLFTMPINITGTIYFLLIAAVFVMTLVVMIQRFQKNLLSDEGYLSFTLPVKTHSHIDAKMLVTLIWIILSVLVIILSVFILAVNQNVILSFEKSYLPFSDWFTSQSWLFVEYIVLFLVGSLSITLHIYASMAVGNLCPKHRLLAAFGAFLGFGVIEQIVATFMAIWRVTSLDDTADLSIVILFAGVFGVAYYFFTDWVLSKKLNLE
jgi:hypothetical protein